MKKHTRMTAEYACDLVNQKSLGEAAFDNIFLSSIFEPVARKSLKQKYQSSVPYRHLSIYPACSDFRLRRVLIEIKEQLNASFKETDLFKVYQTCDLGGFSSKLKRSSELLALRSSIYSREFRALISDISGCGVLSDRVDCSCNIYCQGGHLLCHDDVIGTRAISFILYLTEPEETWKESDGGALELFDKEECEPLPRTYPSKLILPNWNKFVFFEVKPGESFHAIQEIFGENKPRVSISGWFHLSDSNMPTKNASRVQLSNKADKNFTPTNKISRPMYDMSRRFELGPKDLSFLSGWISREYLMKENISAIQKNFSSNKCVQLRCFLKPEISENINALLFTKLRTDRTEGCDSKTSRNWKVIGPPHKQRYLKLENKEKYFLNDATLCTTFRDLEETLFKSSAYNRWLLAITGQIVSESNSAVRKFRRGQDYTIAHDNSISKDRKLHSTLCFVKSDTKNEYDAWMSGNFGGFECFVPTSSEVEESDATAEVYDTKSSEEHLISVHASFNTLSLVHNEEHDLCFVKYLSKFAPSDRYDVHFCYNI
jgi:Rps23 Pro-64 3,4-dihydroxylase Tpa1-like proline 4-hydroxylase